MSLSLTLQEAIEIAEKHPHDPGLDEINEFPDRYVLWYGGSDCEDGDVLLTSCGVSVMKETGEVGSFFPPHFDADYLKSGKKRRVPKKYRA